MSPAGFSFYPSQERDVIKIISQPIEMCCYPIVAPWASPTPSNLSSGPIPRAARPAPKGAGFFLEGDAAKGG